MNDEKCRALKSELATQPQPQIVSITQFFDGNDDLGSIGCNLEPHPGIGTFRNILTGLLARPDVKGVYAQIFELDPGDGCWPFTDLVLVAGTIPAEELQKAVAVLQPDEIGTAESFGATPSVGERHGSPVTAIWWD